MRLFQRDASIIPCPVPDGYNAALLSQPSDPCSPGPGRVGDNVTLTRLANAKVSASACCPDTQPVPSLSQEGPLPARSLPAGQRLR